MATRDEFVQKAIASGLTDPGRLKAAMEERRRTIGAFDDEVQEQSPPMQQPQPAPQPQQDKEPSYLGRIGQYWTKDLPEAGKGLWDRFSERSRRIDAPTVIGQATGNEALGGIPERLTRTAAGAFGTIGDATGTVLGLAGKAANNVSGGALEKVPGAFAKAMPGTANAVAFLAQKAKEYGGHLQEWYDQQPEADKANLAASIDLTEAFGIIPGGKAAFGKTISAMDKVAAQSTEQFAPKAMKALQKTDDAIDIGWEKGIKPKVNGKKTFARMDAAADYNKEAVKTIVDLKDQLNIVDDAGERVIVPRNAKEYAQAIDQAKKVIYKQYNDMTKAATGQGARFDATGIINELDRVSQDVASGATPERRAIAKAMIPEIQELHGMPLETVENRIAEYNSMLKSFYNNPDNFSKATVTANLAAALRENLDNVISSSQGPGYQKLKNQYGALKAVEGEVNHRAIVNARRAKNSVVDFTDVFTSGETLAGLATGNGPLVVKGLVGRAIKEGIKAQNNPERYVKKMFRSADNLSGTGQPLRGGLEYTLRQHETPPLVGNRITDESRMLPYQMLGEQGAPQPGNMQIPVGAKVRGLGVNRDVAAWEMPGSSAPAQLPAKLEQFIQDYGTVEELKRLRNSAEWDKLTPDQAARIDDFLAYQNKFDKSDNLRVKGYRKKGMTKIGDILNRSK